MRHRAPLPGFLRRPVIGMLLPVMVGCASAVSGGTGEPRTLSPGTHVFVLRHDGLTRTYRVHAPPSVLEGTPLPVMLAFHGGGGNGQQFQESSGIPRVADREGFLAVFPEGTGPLRLHTWNAGGCCGSSPRRGVDDVGFTDALLDDLARRTPVDADRIYATGHSNGAMMAYRLAAERGHRIAATVPVAGAMSPPVARPVRPVAILHIHSVDDPRALYHGGEAPPFPGTRVTTRHSPVQETLATWLAVNGCTGDPVVGRRLEGAPGTPEAGRWAEELRWDRCEGGAPVVHWRLHGVGHGWPGDGSARRRERTIGPVTALVDAAEEGWRFASQFSLRP